MKRHFGLAIVTLLAVWPAVASPAARQEERTPIEVHKIAENLYMLSSEPSAGNTTVFVTDTGVVLADTMLPGYGADIMARVRSITDKPVTTIISSHAHSDHTGSNTEFSDTIEFVAHENALKQLSRETCEWWTDCAAFKGDNVKYLPGVTFTDQMSLLAGPDQIDLHYFGVGETNSDAFVVFKDARVMHAGDMFQSKGLPYVDVEDGNGSAVSFGATLQRAVESIQNVDVVIAGHTETPSTWNDFVEFTGFYNDLLSTATEALAAGRSVDDVVNTYSVPDRFSEFEVTPESIRTFVQLVYDELE